jgi:hypothetical protein
MLEKITELKEQSSNPQVQALCENAIASFGNVIYNNVSGDARVEIERATMNGLFNELSKIDESDIQTWVANGKRLFTLQNLGVREAISKIQKAEGKNEPGLNEWLNNFKLRLEDEPEVLLYEEFISGTQAFAFYPAIGSAIDDLAKRVNTYKNDIDLTKIMEVMKKTRSSYLVPYIERYVNNYIDNKTDQNKSFLKEALIKFSYDPFVRDIISVVTIDTTTLKLENANAECDVDKVYSPLIYLGENEAVFNVKGVYYIKKGNHISRLPKNDFKKLDEEYVRLCEIINSDNVEIVADDIRLYIGEDNAVINGKGVMINDAPFDHSKWKRMSEAAQWAGNGEFLYKVALIKKNLNEIAEIDFVKRVFLKEDQNYSADIFKLRDNVFITTHNPQMGKSTFYRNVNPIQAKNIMMEHLRFDVSRLFESLLPQEEKIRSEISETKKSYTDYIRLLEGKIENFKRQNINETTHEVISALEEELKEIKTEYKDYLNMIERYMVVPDDVDVSDLSEEIKITIDMNGQKYVVPLPDQPGQAGQSGEATAASGGEQQAGTVPGGEDMEEEPASAVTFDDNETELLGDSPSIQDDEVDLGSEEAEEEVGDAEEAEEDAKDDMDDEEAEAESDGYEDEDEIDLDFDDEEDEDEDQNDELKKKEKKKKDKNESSEGSNLGKSSFVSEEGEEKKPQKKVFLKKKKQ